VLHLVRLCLVVVVAAGLAAPAEAFQLVPITQDFEPSGRGATKTFQLQNESDEQVAITVSVVTRAMSPEGEETNADTEDFIVVPEQAVVPARGVQTVRVQWVGEPSPQKELAYRIIAEQVPVAFTQRPRGGAVQVIVRYVGSIYVVPKGAQPDVKVESAANRPGPDGKPRLELTLVNSGSAHAIIDEPVLSLVVNGKKRDLKEGELPALAGLNVLPDSRRRVVMPWPADLPVGAVEAALTLRPAR
jgi:fimbrial chaperone protein